ncbi:hypothetical protein PAECIP111893_05308 [Paenibacillus plantiphilus]|uniref:Uncharacterized protein n=1 Tax=Paenibacillus plantiphilus TaxID=2905650 RepID=A0ABN8H3L2_9BACL|nr:hypothetical protein PAECIP111893_05308 [Paenibacillus plantiphilus]
MANKLGKLSGFAIENEYHFLGDHVMAEGTDQTSYPPYDDEPKEGTPPPPPPPPPKKKFSWGSLLGNVLAGIAVVVVVAVVAAVTVATLGAGTVVIGAVFMGAMAAGSIAVGSRAISDIARDEVSSTWDYMTDAFRESMIGAASGAIFGPFAAGARVMGQMVVGGVTGVFESVVSQLTDNREGFSLGEALFSGGIGFLTGGLLDVKIARRTIGDYLGSGIGKITPDWLKRGFGSIFDGFGSAVQGLSRWGSSLGGKFLNHIQDFGSRLAKDIQALPNTIRAQSKEINDKMKSWLEETGQNLNRALQGPQFAFNGGYRNGSRDVFSDPYVNRMDSGSSGGGSKGPEGKGKPSQTRKKPDGRLPKTGGKWEGEPGNGKWYSDDPDVIEITNGKPIVFKDGRPDFSPWSAYELEFKPGVLNGTDQDFDQVYKRMAELGLAKNKTQAKALLKQAGLTPHHLSETVIEMIPTKLHGNIPHKGSASDMRNKTSEIIEIETEKVIPEKSEGPSKDRNKGGPPTDDDD